MTFANHFAKILTIILHQGKWEITQGIFNQNES